MAIAVYGWFSMVLRAARSNELTVLRAALLALSARSAALSMVVEILRGVRCILGEAICLFLGVAEGAREVRACGSAGLGHPQSSSGYGGKMSTLPITRDHCESSQS